MKRQSDSSRAVRLSEKFSYEDTCLRRNSLNADSESSSPVDSSVYKEIFSTTKKALGRFFNTLAKAIRALKETDWSNNQLAIQAIERLVPTFENLIINPKTPDGLKWRAIRALEKASYHNNQLAIQALENLIINPKTPDDLKWRAIRALEKAAYHNNQLAIQALENLIINPKISYGLKKMAILALEKAAYHNSQFAIQAIERLTPTLENLITNPKTSYSLKEMAIRALEKAAYHNSQFAIQAIERLTPTLENLIANPKTSYSLKGRAAQRLARLPLSTKGPQLPSSQQNYYPDVSIDEVLARIKGANNPRFISRSLVYDLESDKVLVIKLLKEKQNPSMLLTEALWVNYLGELQRKRHFDTVRFDIPKILEFGNNYVISLNSIPLKVPNELKLHPNNYTICFIASKDYFSYPNETLKDKIIPEEQFREVILSNSYLLGYLANLGIIHTDVISLFHNRPQRGRRVDRGGYQWWEEGRLDQWLVSCDYPNIGITGVRDFEHFISWQIDSLPLMYQDHSNLYYPVGTQLLSLLLISSSYFRNKDRARAGFDRDGNPIDVRNLFNKELLNELIAGIFKEYYRGFVEEVYEKDLPFDLASLAENIIEQMGIDRHMEETFRREDQREMSDKKFKAFLEESGFSKEEIAGFNKDQQNITIYTGPHLGRFNRAISLPEMTRAIERMSALMITGKYRHEKDLE